MVNQGFWPHGGHISGYLEDLLRQITLTHALRTFKELSVGFPGLKDREGEEPQGD